MRIEVRSALADSKAYSYLPKIDVFEGEIVATPKWVEYPAIALTTGDKKWPVRIIAQDQIISINNSPFVAEKIQPTVKQYQVTGSKGDIYTVSIDGKYKSCTCHAFQFRRNCKHITQVQ